MLSKITSWRHSKIIAFVLAVAVFLTAFYGLSPVISLAGETESATEETETVGYWYGDTPTVAEAFEGQEGDGSNADKAYKIYDGKQLYAAVHSGADLYFKLMNDIVLQKNDTDAQTVASFKSATEYNTEGLLKWQDALLESAFIGHIDGNSKTIKGLLIDATSTSNTWNSGYGFIGRVAGNASISNLTIDGAFVKSVVYTGGLIGVVSSGSSNTVNIEGIVLKNSKILNTASINTIAAGGIIGMLTSATTVNIGNCSVYNNVFDIKGTDKKLCGSMAGDPWANNSIKVTNSLFLDCYPCAKAVSSAAYTNVYTNTLSNGSTGTGTTLLADAELKGYAMPGIDHTTGWQIEENEYPKYVGVGNTTAPVDKLMKWNGTKGNATAILAGMDVENIDGKEVKLIYYPYELYAAVKSNENSNFKLKNNIQLQNDDDLAKIVSAIASGVAPESDTINNWDDGDKRFIGTFDGNFKTITGLYISAGNPGDNYGNGFIDALGKDSTVKNVILDNAYINGGHRTGGIVGFIDSGDKNNKGTGDIIGCTVKNSRVAGGTDVGLITGGGWYVTNATAQNCAAYDNILTGDNPGAIYGQFWGGGSQHTISNNISANNKKDSADGADLAIGGLGQNGGTCNYANTTGVGVTTTLEPDQMKGVVLPGITPSLGWRIAEGEYPEYREDPIPESYSSTTWNGLKYASGVALDDILAGEGTEPKPYKIYHGFELYAALQNTEADKHFEVMNDIYLNTGAFDLKTSNPWALWEAKKEFSGNLNGNGHTIYGLYEPSQEGYHNTYSTGSVGLIPIVNNATINDLHVRNADILSWSSEATGVLVGKANNVTINGCSVSDATVKIGVISEASGFVGKVTGTASITDSVFASGTIRLGAGASATSVTGGGFVGNMDGATVTLNNVVSNGYKTVANGTASETYAYSIAADGDYKDMTAFKADLLDDTATLSDAFYWDNLSGNAPLLKNRKATVDKDIDGDDDAIVDAGDVSALKNIVLYDGGINQVTVSDTVNGYNAIAGIDITDIVAVKKNIK